MVDHDGRPPDAPTESPPSLTGTGRSQLRLFVVLAYGLSWSWWLPMLVAGARVETGRGWPTHLVGLMGPAIAAMVATAVYGGRDGLRDLAARCVRWRVDQRVWWLVLATILAGLLPPLVTGADLDGFGRYSGAPQWGPLMVVFVLVVNGYGEELGWRGVLWDVLRTRHGFRRSTLTTWAVWGLWHLPLFWIVASFADMGPLGAAGWAVGLFFGTVVLGWLYEFADRSLLAVVVWHVAYNFGVATDATGPVGAAVLTMGVIVGGVAIMRVHGRDGPRPPGAVRRPPVVA